MTAQPASVLEFPDRASRSWRTTRGQLYDWFRAEGVPAEVLDLSLDKVGEIYKRLPGTTIPVDAGVPLVVEAMKAWVSEIVMHLIVEIATREFELRQAGLRD